MRNYIILNGTSSNTINGLLIQSLAPISKPLMRTDTEEIDGRDGDISIPLGFSAYDKEITIGLYGTYDINQVISFFNSEGTVTFSNEPDKYYNYQIFDQIDFERLIRFKTATVTFHIQPFKFATTGESQTLDSGDPVSDEGTNLVLEGSGEAPFSQFDLKGNTEQNGTPTPDAPVPVQTTTGENVVEICGKNLFNKNNSGILDDVRVSTSNGKTYGSVGSHVSYFIKVKPSTNYTLTTGRNAYYSWYSAPSEDSYISGSGWQDRYYFKSPANAQYIRFDFTDGNIVQFVEGTSVGAYEPYQGQSYEVNLGKNLFYAQDTSNNGVNLVYNSTTGKINLSGTPSNSWAIFSLPTITIPAGTYTISIQSALSFNIALGITNAGGTRTTKNIMAGNTSYSFTISEGMKLDLSISGLTSGTDMSAEVFFQLEKGSQASSYATYFEPIELCKIGDYQDSIYKSGEKWYVRKETNKIVFDGTESWQATSGVNPFYVTFSPAAVGNYCDGLCSYFRNLKAYPSSSGYFAIRAGGTSASFNNSATATLSDWKAWLATNNVPIYYPLATPTDTEITNEALIEQLDDIYYHAHAYKGRTHIASLAATGNVPHIIAATVNGDASGTITNAGNIYSKPKLTVYGTGDIGIYLNGVQMFQIALGTSGYITIDTNLMEAYQDNLETLMNRQVTGDYSNFKLPVGESTISFSGAVTSCVVENYSRWL